eukprot:762128-Hanusia_phi.AAC.6
MCATVQPSQSFANSCDHGVTCKQDRMLAHVKGSSSTGIPGFLFVCVESHKFRIGQLEHPLAAAL